MKIEVTNEVPLDVKRGRKAAFDYSIFRSAAVVKVSGDAYDKVRYKINNLATQAKALGYDVRTYLVQRGSTYIGCVTRRGD